VWLVDHVLLQSCFCIGYLRLFLVLAVLVLAQDDDHATALTVRDFTILGTCEQAGFDIPNVKVATTLTAQSTDSRFERWATYTHLPVSMGPSDLGVIFQQTYTTCVGLGSRISLLQSLLPEIVRIRVSRAVFACCIIGKVDISTNIVCYTLVQYHCSDPMVQNHRR
jgi:hypothetical protein